MKRFWIKFALSWSDLHRLGILLGCGVTANNQEAALDVVQSLVFKGNDLPAIEEIREDVQIESLEANHVLPNIGDPDKEGIWYPLGYGQTVRLLVSKPEVLEYMRKRGVLPERW